MEMNQYLEIFIEESKEHIQACNDHLLVLEKNPEDVNIINEIFRSAHTLKGMAATMGFEDIAKLTHQMENVLDDIRNRKTRVTPELLDVVFLAVDDLETMLQSITEGGDGKRDIAETVEKLASRGQIEIKGPIQKEGREDQIDSIARSTYDEFELTVLQQSTEQGFSCYEILIQLRKDCLLKIARVFMIFDVFEKIGEVIKSNPTVEELEEEKFDDHFIVTLITNETANNIQESILNISEIEKVDVQPISVQTIRQRDKNVEQTPTDDTTVEVQEMTTESVQRKNEPKKDETSSLKNTASKTIRVNIDRLDILMNLFEELVIDRGRLEQISHELNNLELQETVERMSRVSADLQNIILNMRMVPIETVFNRFPRMVRELTRELHKKINLEIIGAETELDRTVIDEIGDPLVHLIRNAIDHGIEMPKERREKGKNEEGTVVLKAYHSGNHIFIEIEDDGAGIIKEKVLQKALSKEIINEQDASTLTDSEIYELIFSSGFSTADKISDISGRGVGLDVVKSKIESLGGKVSIDSQVEKGSKFSIQLPLTVSIISVMLVDVQNETYCIPISSIIETAIIQKSEILHSHNQELIDLRGKVIPLIYLKDIYEVPGVKDTDDFYSVVIIKKGDKMAGLIVDSFIGQQEIVLKSLGHYLTPITAVSGSTILGDGKVALIIDCNALLT
ncbi:chemotaxis protein CheA [Bacillus sp. 03113]|uniref:chemotaxis protein CheA n=1 Tax=Bacillus sp. 03113 TaxID=2578211 RepID=UPI001141774C|nr:chemotaxis protein CheA [Bacillus sp. 03113]